MNSLEIRSCKHQNNSITFIREDNNIYVEGVGRDSWTQTDTVILKTPLDIKAIKVLRGKGDNDITVTIESAKNIISAVIGSPGQAGDTYNSTKTYHSFSGIIEGSTTIHDLLLKILD